MFGFGAKARAIATVFNPMARAALEDRG